MNKLYLGDCLDVLRNELEIKPESIDLIYIDPPFNSKRNYSVFFDDKELQTQRMAFEDTWSLHSVGDSLTELDTIHHDKLLALLNAYQNIAPQVFPYLVMMTLRIIELHKVLKPTGSFYLHCDPTASHYLKTVCDAVFGVKNFRNEIIWCYKLGGRPQKGFPKKHDIILFYSKSDEFHFFDDTIRVPYESDGGYVKTGRKIVKGKVYEVNPLGKIPEDWWFLSALNRQSKERLGYPTQKPKALLERIIKACSNEGDIVLDAFCGCGTTVDTAEGLNRKWIGIDIAPFAISLIKRRLQDTYGNDLSQFEVRGTPTDELSAIKLWEQNPFAFEDWWLTELEVFATTYGKKGADKGIDGIGQYSIPKFDESVKVGFQVKGGKVQSKDIDALFGAITKHKYNMGVLLTRYNPTKPMLNSATQFGQFEAVYGYKYPKIQIMTLAEFFSGKQLNLPKDNITFKSAATIGKGSQQNGCFA
ncbi:MAG: site-specific DNA-methyltransferase [Gammaproteobacteria bacterium]|nr:MAG: site-specific DNA-methyltransferase [Gammaproteobacteria bacterium]RKZ75018.1 MAG: site-specific DNA-methyltransferase [Gammaproteobacteria bacterium]